jgi:hypothetical protein
MQEQGPVELHHLEAALATLRQRFFERQQRSLRASIGEAERQGDLARLAALTAEKLKLDHQVRELHSLA